MLRQLVAIPMLAVIATLGNAQSSGRPATRRPSSAKPAASDASAPKPAAPVASSLPTEATIDAFMKRTFAYDPKLRWNIVDIRQSEAPGVAQVTVTLSSEGQGEQTMRLFVLGERWAFTGEMIPFGADPFGPVRDKLQARANGPAQGPADAPVTIVEFSDLQCPACKATQPAIDRVLQDVPNVRFVFQNFPLPMHSWAFKAATYSDCMGRDNNPAIWKFIHLVFDNQSEIKPENADARLKELAGEAGANADQIASCAAQPATENRVRLSQALGISVNVEATPTIFINGRKVSNALTIPYEMLKALVQGTPK